MDRLKRGKVFKRKDDLFATMPERQKDFKLLTKYKGINTKYKSN